MKRRQILQNVKPTKTEVPAEERVVEEDNVFNTEKPPVPDEEPVSTEPPAPAEPKDFTPVDLPPSKKDAKAERYAHLAKARQKSIETRRRKAKEREMLESEVSEYREKLEWERLKSKYGKPEAPKAPKEEPAPAPAPEPKVSSQAEPYPYQGSAIPEADMSRLTLDYDRLIGGVADRLAQQNSYLSQIEADIREDERRKAEASYKEQMKKWEQDQHRKYTHDRVYSALSTSHRKNQVFNRTQDLRQQYSERYKNGWYNY